MRDVLNVMAIVRVTVNFSCCQSIQCLIRYICIIHVQYMFSDILFNKKKLDVNTAAKTKLLVARFSNKLEQIHKKDEEEEVCIKEHAECNITIISKIELTQESFTQRQWNKICLIFAA